SRFGAARAMCPGRPCRKTELVLDSTVMAPRATAVLLLSVLATAAAAQSNRYRRQQTYSMPSAVYYHQQAQWNQFLSNHNAEVAREQALVQYLNANQLSNISARPAYEPPQPR